MIVNNDFGFKALVPYMLLSALAGNATIRNAANAQAKPNVLFIAVDDLRPELFCYGAKHMHTPNIDRIANKGMLFRKAYCQQAVCAPSRNTVLTGLRPDALGIYDLGTYFRKKAPDVITLPEYFKMNGYRTEAIGKIYHPGHGNQDDPQSWSIPAILHRDLIRRIPEVTRGDTTGLQSDFPKYKGASLPYYISDAPEENMTDGIIGRLGVERIKALRDSSFFLAIGFIKPHLPFVAPRKYWDFYDRRSITLPAGSIPDEMPSLSLNILGEIRGYHGVPRSGPLKEELIRALIHGYYASVSMIDAQIGKLLDALEECGLTENTIIVLWGDHGFKLGEYGAWAKHSNMELDTNAPLLIASPEISGGQKTESLTEFVDIYPTLCDLAGLEKPAHLEGASLVPILKNPLKEIKQVAISQYPRGERLGYDNKMEIMGYSIRNGDFRYTRWQKYENPDEIIARELYYHKFGKVAQTNLANQKEYQDEVERLEKLLTSELAKYKFLKSYPELEKP